MLQVLRRTGLVCLALLLCSGLHAYGAEKIPTTSELMEKYNLQPGMKITAENADLIKDLVPEATYNRTKKGDLIFTIGQFESPDLLAHVWDKDYLDSNEQNKGKYDVDADGGIVKKGTTERPWPMPLGYPYPDIDFNESPMKIGTKMMWNVVALSGSCGEQDHEGARLASSPRNGAPDRGFVPKVLRQYIDFRRRPTQIERPVIFQEIFFFSEPSDAFGSSNLTWRWADPKKWDSVWSYSPSTRRVKRLTAANRSDATLGTEFTQDDGTPSYNGKIEMMEWKYVGKGVALMPVSRTPEQAADDYVARVTYDATHSQQSEYKNVPGSFQQRYKKVTFGSMENPQKYASFWAIDLLWVPVPVYIVEAMPKDPYYNYGRQIYYLEQNTFVPNWKQIYNRSGEYWRTGGLWFEFPRFKVEEGKEIVCLDGVATSIIDEKSNRGTVGVDTGDTLRGRSGGPTVAYNTGLGSDIFQLERFLEYGK